MGDEGEQEIFVANLGFIPANIDDLQPVDFTSVGSIVIPSGIADEIENLKSNDEDVYRRIIMVLKPYKTNQTSLHQFELYNGYEDSALAAYNFGQYIGFYWASGQWKSLDPTDYFLTDNITEL